VEVKSGALRQEPATPREGGSEKARSSSTEYLGTNVMQLASRSEAEKARGPESVMIQRSLNKVIQKKIQKQARGFQRVLRLSKETSKNLSGFINSRATKLWGGQPVRNVASASQKATATASSRNNDEGRKKKQPEGKKGG